MMQMLVTSAVKQFVLFATKKQSSCHANRFNLGERAAHSTRLLSTIVILCALASQLATISGAAAQVRERRSNHTYPVRPIRIVVASETGALQDVFARWLGEKLTEAWGQQVVVDNRPGGGGVIGYGVVSQSQPDGYTLNMAAITIATTPAVVKKLLYDPVKSFTQITRFASAPYVVLVSSQLPVDSVKGLFNLARSRPLNYGSPGVGSAQNLGMELLKLATGVRIKHIPYRGGPSMVAALLRGEVQVIFAGLPPSLSLIKAGKLRILAVTAAHRFPTLPNVPTMAEAAGVPAFELDNWSTVTGPAGIPKALVRKLNAEIVRVLELPEFKKRLLVMGAVPTPSTPEEAHRFIRTEVAKWKKAAKAAGIKPE